MRLLLDTHSFLWFVGGNSRLSSPARTVIEDATNEAFLSIASLWEMGIKISLGKLNIAQPFEEFITRQLAVNHIQLLPITLEHVARIVTLPFHHRDPFDRLLAVQGLAERMPIVSIDEVFTAYGLMQVW